MLTKMSQKGVAVPYIIAIVLGIVVIGLIGYWLFVSGGRFGTSAAQQQCNSDFLTACQQWASGGYDGNAPGNLGVFSSIAGNECMRQVVPSTSATAIPSKTAYRAACGLPSTGAAPGGP